MKIIRLSFAILSLACIAHGATNEGFEITSYFPKKGIVGIEYNGVRTNRPFSSFTAVEQRQITDWRTDQEFESSGLSVEIEKKQTRHAYPDERGSLKRRRVSERVYYEVTVVNNTDAVLNDIQIECRTFFLQDITQSQQLTNPGGDKCCKIDQFTLSIVPGETRKVIAAGITIRDWKTDPPSSSSFFTMSTIYTKDDLEGFFVSVSRKDRNGEVHSKTYEKGIPPNERKWVDYHEPRGSRSAQPNSISEDKAVFQNRESTTDSTTKNQTFSRSEDVIAKYTQQADAGSYRSAYNLYITYRHWKDFEKMKYWADKTREIIAKLPVEDPMATRMLTALDRLEKGTP